MREAVVWYLTVQLAGLAAWPLVERAVPGLDEHGWACSKVVGVLGVSWIVWLVCMLAPVPFSGGTLWLALLAVAGLGWLAAPPPQKPSLLRRWGPKLCFLGGGFLA